MQFLSHSTQETEAIGEELAQKLRGGDVLAFTGSLGMGKTAFTRGLARGLGCRGRVTSPTFTIVNEYEGRTPLFHFDMYRLGSSDELFDIGWDDYLARGGVCAVEWSERVSDALPEDTIFVDIARTLGICLVVPNALLWLVYRRTVEWKELWSLIQRIIKKVSAGGKR